MSLLITITKYPGDQILTETSKTFEADGGSIGRGADNTWTLSDPERFLSSKHCQINCENNQYFLSDLSTNGTFFNGSPEPLGKGKQTQLNDGDQFVIGEYEFSISLFNPLSDPMGNSPEQQETFPPASASDNLDPFASPNASNDVFSSPANSGSPFDSPMSVGLTNDQPLFNTPEQETDPLAALDKAQTPSYATPQTDDIFSQGASQADQAEPFNQSINWPSSSTEAGAIPENWDDDLLANNPKQNNQAPVNQTPGNQAQVNTAPANQVPANQAVETSPSPIPQAEVSQQPVNEGLAGEHKPGENKTSAAEISLDQKKQALERANQKIQQEIDLLKQQVEAQKIQSQQAPISNGISSDQVTNALIQSIGFDDKNLDQQQCDEIGQIVGQLVRETVAGMMQVLSSRNSIKNEFRMNVTTIQPVENNPLKFSANVDDALENMFLKKGNAYKKPIEAVREGFDGISEHQVAILAGIRSAFKGVIERFNPETLERRFERHNKAGLIPGSQKAKNWDSFKDYYSEMADDMDNSFQYLFGDEFVRAYEDQLQKLAISRNSKK